MTSRSIAVIGSLNMDFVTRTTRIPEGGETLTANAFDIGCGGKGANQAVACSRLSGGKVQVQMAGNVGDDIFGRDIVDAMRKESIDVSRLRMLDGQKTGVANILVEESTGENRILLAANSNHAFSKEPDASWDMVPETADMVVFQLEIPLPVVLHNLHEARRSGRHTLLNPAPALVLPDSAYGDIDTLVMNETESAMLAGDEMSKADLKDLATYFLEKGVRDAVIITLGGSGLFFATSSGLSGHILAEKVEVVDTTAAGDTFVGAYAVQRVADSTKLFDYSKALQYATLAASKTVGRAGAMTAIPYSTEIQPTGS